MFEAYRIFLNVCFFLSFFFYSFSFVSTAVFFFFSVDAKQNVYLKVTVIFQILEVLGRADEQSEPRRHLSASAGRTTGQRTGQECQSVIGFEPPVNRTVSAVPTDTSINQCTFRTFLNSELETK